MHYHLVTEPFPEWLNSNQNNLCLSFWPQLLSGFARPELIRLSDVPRLTIDEKISQNEKVRDLREKILPKLATNLRKIHSVEFTDDYWEILLYPWLTCALSNYVSRLQLFRNCMKTGEISSVCAITSATKLLPADDTTDYFKLILDPYWKNLRDQRILRYLNFSGIFLNVSNSHREQAQIERHKVSIIRKLQKAVQTFSMLFNRFNSGYFENSYLPPITEARTQLLLGQIPVSNRSRNWRDYLQINAEVSIHRDFQFPPEHLTNGDDGDLLFLSNELWSQIPRMYLENYATIRSLSSRFFPKNCKFAFTSNSFHQDEIFKFWIAEAKTKGTIYIVGQHGNDYGANKLMLPTAEEVSSDFFLTWGWVSENPKFVPIHCITTAGRPHSTLAEGGLLLLSRTIPNEHAAWDETRDYFDQLSQQHAFVNKLEMEIRSETTVRLAPLNSRMMDNFPNSWLNHKDLVSIDRGYISYRKIRPNYRLAVFSYDSTGLLEGLSSNVPTMAFWLDGLDHLNFYARQKYQYLIDAEIIFFDSKKCASKVNDIWEDVSGWWNSSEVQSARIEFCKGFCESSQNPASVIAAAIREALDSSVPQN